jgi:hypothetical protein
MTTNTALERHTTLIHTHLESAVKQTDLRATIAQLVAATWHLTNIVEELVKRSDAAEHMTANVQQVKPADFQFVDDG